MVSDFASDTAAVIAAWLGGLLTAASVLCIAAIFMLRALSERSKQTHEMVVQKWETTLFEATDIIETDANTKELTANAKSFFELNPHLDRRDLPHLLYEWNYIHESLVGESKQGLNFLAEKVDLSELSVKMLRSPMLDKRLLAINTLGNLGDQTAYDEIEKALSDRDSVISSWAWRALFRIDTQRTLGEHLSLIAERKDWSPIFVARVLQEIDADICSAPLCRLVEKSYTDGIEERQMSRLISYLSLAHVADHTAIVNKILLESNAMEVLIACLRLVNSDDDLTRIREMTKDEHWEIRLHAALTLGRLGHEEDIERLIDLLDDPDWWVRYRTASALIAIPTMTEKRVLALTETLPNQFARDILLQVLTEMRLLCFTQTSLTLSR